MNMQNHSHKSSQNNCKKTADQIWQSAYTAEVKDMGGEALGVKTDVQNVAEIEALVKKTVDTYGHLDIMVNNAAVFV